MSILYYQSLTEKQMAKELALYKNQVDNGKQICAKSSIILVGLIRDSVHNIPFIQTFYEQLKQHFSKTLFIIVENDSKDGTRVELIKWANLDKSVQILCHGPTINALSCSITGFETPILESHPFPSRICRLTQLRNLYMNYIYEHVSPNDYH